MKKEVIIDILCGLILASIITILLILNYTSIPFAGTYERSVGPETEKLILGSNRHFSYYSLEGNVTRDYDLCDKYKYNSSKNVINLKCDGKLSGGSPTKIKVVFFDDEKIILNFNGEERTFLKVKN